MEKVIGDIAAMKKFSAEVAESGKELNKNCSSLIEALESGMKFVKAGNSAAQFNRLIQDARELKASLRLLDEASRSAAKKAGIMSEIDDIFKK